MPASVSHTLKKYFQPSPRFNLENFKVSCDPHNLMARFAAIWIVDGSRQHGVACVAQTQVPFAALADVLVELSPPITIRTPEAAVFPLVWIIGRQGCLLIWTLLRCSRCSA